MPAEPPNYRRLFWRSRQHLWLALLTLGLGFASGQPLALLAGGVLYALGLLHLPDTAWFRRQIDARLAAASSAADQARARDFATQRARLLEGLTTDRRERYQSVVRVCQEIQNASADPASPELALSLDTRLRKLDELLWTYLRLLTVGQSLELYLESERRENLPAVAAAAEEELAALQAGAAARADTPGHDTRLKLVESRRERLDALRQRLDRTEQARANLALARAEQERLLAQAKLIRADAVAHKNAEALGARIDLSIEHLAQTNRWLAELAEFKDLTQQLPALPAGSMLAAPPPLPASSARNRQSTGQSSP